MGFLGDLIDDVLEIPKKIIRVPVEIMSEAACIMSEGHEWGAWVAQPDGKFVRVCAHCGAKDKR